MAKTSRPPAAGGKDKNAPEHRRQALIHSPSLDQAGCRTLCVGVFFKLVPLGEES